MSIENISLSGYEDSRDLLAQRYERAGKSLFVIALPIHLVRTHLPIPDPDQPAEGNRTVSSSRASAFGTYWRENRKWATPPLLLDTTYPLSDSFERRMSVAGVDFGVLRLPYNSESELKILDGQHRILGWSLETRKIAEELRHARENILRAQDRGAHEDADRARRTVEGLAEVQSRLKAEYVTVEILEGVTLDDHKQYFHDIATNAKGITKSITASFDRRSAVNRVAMAVASSHPLLDGRVEGESDTVRGQNSNWISNKNLTDLITTLSIGTGASMTQQRKRALKDEALERVTVAFLDALQDEFFDLTQVSDGLIDTKELRSASLLGSPTILRALAGAFHAIAVDASVAGSPVLIPNGDSRMRNLFSLLSTQMGLPVNDGWYATGLFPERTSQAPSSKTQDLKSLAEQVSVWARRGEPFASVSS